MWLEIRAGRIADFDGREGRQDSPLEPTTLQGWGEERKLRAAFLEGARIIGAWFPEAVELGHGRLARQLWLEKCRFEGPASFSGQPSDGLAADLPTQVVYSLYQLLPSVEFEKSDKVVLTNGVERCFYAQKLVGWALGSFLVADLAGLTQKQ